MITLDLARAHLREQHREPGRDRRDDAPPSAVSRLRRLISRARGSR